MRRCVGSGSTVLFFGVWSVFDRLDTLDCRRAKRRASTESLNIAYKKGR